MLRQSARLLFGLVLTGIAFLAVAQERGAPLPAQVRARVVGPVRIKIEDKEPQAAPVLIEPEKHIDYESPDMLAVCKFNGETMSHGSPGIKIDGTLTWQSGIDSAHTDLPKKDRNGKAQDGYVEEGHVGKIRVSQTVLVVASESLAGAKRRRDTVLNTYVIENEDNEAHEVGMVLGVSALWSVDSSRYALPGQILDGVELKGSKVPRQLLLLKNRDLKNPLFVGHVTFDLGGVEMPSRTIFTSSNNSCVWKIEARPSNGGSSAMYVFWDPKKIPPRGKRVVGLGLGAGVVHLAGVDLEVSLSGSFEPGKIFNVRAFVPDPVRGQSLTLALSPGLEIIEGKEIQPLPDCEGEGVSLVQWKARVLRPGRFTLDVRSSTGVSRTKIITVTKKDR